MSVKRLLSDKEFNKLQSDFNKVIKWVAAIEEPRTDKLFADWYEAKQRFISSFGGMIYTYPEKVELHLDPEAKLAGYKEMEGFLDNLSWESPGLVRADINNWFFGCVDTDALFNNTTIAEYEAEDKSFKIPKGAKVVKALKHFITDKELLTNVQNVFSEIIQQDKISGYLCASVHPLDFLSASENTYNWRSCHALDGDYRAGNLAYMTDINSFMVYLRAEDTNIHLPMFPQSVPWNSKKWRMMVYLSDDCKMMFAGRQYPISANNMFKQLLPDMLNKCGIASYGQWGDWTSETSRKIGFYEFYRAKYPCGDGLKNLKEFFKDGSSLIFNDVLQGTNYQPMYSCRIKNILYTAADNESSSFTIGGPATCCHCGEEPITSSELFCCNNCFFDNDYFEHGVYSEDMEPVTCACCGDSDFLENMYWVEDGSIVCAECEADYTFVCGNCGGRFFKTDEYNWDDSTGYAYCNECFRYYDKKRGN